MLALADVLRADYDITLVAPRTAAGARLRRRADALGVKTRGISLRPVERQREDVRRVIAEGEFDLFHGHAGVAWEGHTGIAAARELEVPAVVRTEHLPYLLTVSQERAAYVRVVESVDALICVSDSTAASYAEAGVPRSRLRVIRNGIPLTEEQGRARLVRDGAGVGHGSPVVLTVARLCEQKGYERLLAAIPSVARAFRDASFLWAGSGPSEEALRAAVRRFDLEEHVRFLGQRNDVPHLMAHADLFVLPSRFEGLPIVLLEAMAERLPVVATRVPGSAELVRDGVTGRLVEPDDTDALAAAIIEALERPDVRRSWANAARLMVEKEYSSTRMADETGAVYEQALARHGRSLQRAG